MADWSEEETADEAAAEAVEIHAAPTGEVYHAPKPSSGVVHHERAVPLPVRIRMGTIAEEHLELEGQIVPWGDVKLITMGIIHHSLGNMDAPNTVVRQMFGKLMGKNDRAERKANRFQEAYLLDVYTNSNDVPFRLDSVNVNYKSFLGREVTFISMHNFYRLAVRLARRSTNAHLNDNAVLFLQRRREQIRPYGAVYDFELESQADLNNRLEHLPKTTDLDLTRDSYAEEWNTPGEGDDWDNP